MTLRSSNLLPLGILSCSLLLAAISLASLFFSSNAPSKPKPARPVITENTSVPATPVVPFAKRLLQAYDQFASEHPEDLEELHEKLQLLTTHLENDPSALPEVVTRRNKLQAKLEQAASACIEERGTSALAFARNGDLASAEAELKRIPPLYLETKAAQRIHFFRHRLAASENEALLQADLQAQKLIQNGNIDAAEAVYKKLNQFKNNDIRRGISMRLQELQDIRLRGLKPLQEVTHELPAHLRYLEADHYLGLRGVREQFETLCKNALHEDPEEALTGIELLLQSHPRSAVLYYAKACAELRNGNEQEAQFASAQSRRLALPNSLSLNARLLCLDARILLERHTDKSLIDQAMEKINEAARLDRYNPEVYFLSGVYFMIYSNSFTQNAEEVQPLAAQGIEQLRKAIALDSIYRRYLPEEAKTTGRDKYSSIGSGGNPYLKSIVLISGISLLGGGHGTGFVVKSDETRAWIITNYHVVEGMSGFTAKYPVLEDGKLVQRETTRVKLLKSDPEHDLALLLLEVPLKMPALKLRKTTTGLTVPMKLTLLGHPASQGVTLDYTVVTGELANLNRDLEGIRHLQLNANVTGGMSGGPILDEAGRVVGVTRGMYIGISGQNIAILSEHVRDLCAQMEIVLELE